MQILTAVRQCDTPIRAKIKQKKKTPNAGESMEKLHNSYIGNVKRYSHSGKEFVNFFKKLTCARHTAQQFVPLSQKVKTYLTRKLTS